MRLHAVLALGLFAAPIAAHGQDADGDGTPDSADFFPCDPRAVAVSYAPGLGVHGQLLIEDQWPNAGDLDFNDAVLTYHYELREDASGGVTGLRLTVNVLALGGTFDNGLGLHLPVSAQQAGLVELTADGQTQALTPSAQDAELTVVLSSNLRNLFGGANGQLNSVSGGAAHSASTLIVDVVFNSPVGLLASDAPYDLFLFRTGQPGLEIHRTGFGGTAGMDQTLFGTGDDGSTSARHFVDGLGLPFVLELPQGSAYPAEGVAVSNLFPNIGTFASSGGAAAQDFYQSSVLQSAAYATPQAATFPQAAHPADNPSCAMSCVRNPDFEGGSVGWQILSGTAFSNFPFTRCHNSGACFGSYGISTLNNGESAVGELESAPFLITEELVCWQNGGFDSSYTGLDLDADGTIDVTKMVRGTSGNSGSGDNWGEQCFDVSPYVGRFAKVRLVDPDAGGSFAWASWDNFSCRHQPSCVYNGNFESGTAGWTATGSAFNNFPHTNCANAGSCFDGHGISTKNNGEPATGTLTSGVFTIEAPQLCWQNGGFGSSRTEIDIDANGTADITIGARGTDGNGASGDGWGEQCADLSAYVGRQARVVLVDPDTGGGYAWAAWDSFTCR